MYRYLLCLLVVAGAISSGGAYYHHDEVYDRPNFEVFDYIVVGVGQSGSVAATRLAESGEYKVLGIDGGDRSHRSLNGTHFVAASYKVDNTGKVTLDPEGPFTIFDVPLYFGGTFLPPTPYEDYPFKYNGNVQRSYTPKVLGGAGAHNGMHWLRLTEANINSWNLDGWSYEEVLEYYKKAENATLTGGTANPSYHGFNGPIILGEIPIQSPLYETSRIFIRSCMEATGLPNNTDFNGPSRFGCGSSQFSNGGGVRSSAANRYLAPAVRKGNIKLALKAIARKILIRRVPIITGAPRAYGVEYEQNGILKRAYATKEVIITMGVPFTSKMLQLSGIGNATRLSSLGIHVWVDNPNVGKNLQSNHQVSGAIRVPNITEPNGFRVSDDAAQYAVSQTGLWAFHGAFGNGFFCAQPNCSDPQTQITQSAGLFNPATVFRTITFTVASAAPTSRGEVYIESADPYAPPVVNYVINDEDVASIVEGVKMQRTLRGEYPGNTYYGPEVSPGPAYSTDAQLTAWVKATYIHASHWVGAAKMGNTGDTSRVCDPQMRVVGVNGLRVGDPSGLHRVNANTQASAVMTGERVAAFALADA